MARRKAIPKPAAPPPTTLSPSAASAPIPTNLTPFTPAPSKLLPFLETLPPRHIYLTSLDLTTPRIKRNAFLVPVLLNSIITLGLLYRIYHALPVYFELLLTTLGHETPSTIDTTTTPLTDLLGVTWTRTFLFMFDYALFSILGAWPWQFVFGSKEGGHVGPVTWRRRIGGFKETEVVVRRSRKWDTSVFGVENKKSRKKKIKPSQLAAADKKPLTPNEILTVKLKVTPAMSPQYLKATSYATLDQHWDLDFAGMVNAYQLTSGADTTLTVADLTNKAFLYHAETKTWLMWTVFDSPSSPSTTSSSTHPAHPTAASEKDSVVDAFRARLAAMGHEDLFFRWIELVQYESSVPGGMTEAKRLELLHEARKMFADAGVDFNKFFNDVGGLAGMPGLGSEAAEAEEE